MSRVAQLPEVVKRRAENAGSAGEAWLASLDDSIDHLARTWRLEIGAAMSGGTAAFVAPARTASGAEAILKISVPGEGDAAARVLVAANGRGYVRVLEHDAARGALLMERLSAQLASFDKTIDVQIEIICETLGQAWLTPPPDACFQNGAEKARSLADDIKAMWRLQSEPCSARAVEIAGRYCAERAAAFDPARCVLAHADAHSYNTLAVPGSSSQFKFVDPEGLFIEPAYDLGIPMREWPEELLAGDPVALGRRRCARLAALTGIAEEPIWQWGLIERVATGHALLQIGWNDLAKQVFAVADAWAQAA